MRSSRRDGNDERRIVLGAITDRTVLSMIAAKWEGELLKSRWSNLLVSWCVKYFNRYGKAPGKNIESIFEQWSENAKDKDTVAIIEQFLQSLSDEYETAKEESNSEYIIDLASQHFNRIRITQLADQIKNLAEDGELDKAIKKVQEYNRIEIGVGSGIDVLNDMEVVNAVFEESLEPIIKMPGALASFYGDALSRDCFVAFMASDKKGKSFFLMDVGWRAMLQGRKVAHFEVGDMSRNQLMRRMMVRAAKHPFKPPRGQEWPCTIKYPIGIEHEPDAKMAETHFEEFIFDRPLDRKTAKRAFRKIAQKHNGEPIYKLSCHPNSSISIIGIRGILQSWERQGWLPDVVIIDYADILAPIDGKAEGREQINATWKQMRALSQSLHCLVVTATQANAGSYTTETLHTSNFSEDKRKLAHVTGIIGINQTSVEKQEQQYRLNWLVLREDEYSIERCVHVASCLALANPCVKSTF